MSQVSIRFAMLEDYEILVMHAKALAEHHGTTSALDVDTLKCALEANLIHAIVASVDEQILGSAIYSRTFSTWSAQANIYLEHLFVSTESRGMGLGRGLLNYILAQLPNGGRIEFKVASTNHASLSFYRSLSAWEQEGWLEMRLMRT